MHKLRKLNIADILLRILLAGIFLYASVDKIQHPQDFASIIRDYRVLPGVLVNVTAIVLPWLELVLGVLLLSGWLREGTLFLVISLLLVFWGILIANYFRGIDVGCGCFSTTASESSPMLWYILRDGLFVVLGLSAAWVHRTRLRGAAAASAGGGAGA